MIFYLIFNLTYFLVYVTRGSLLAGYLEFYFAKQRDGLDPLSLND